MALRTRPIVLRLAVVLGLIVTGCSATTSTEPAPAGPTSTSPSAEDSASAASTSAQATKAQAALDAALPADGPGCSTAFERDGTVIWTGVRGLADLAAGTPIGPDTIFDIGSVAKQFTAVAVLLQVADGTLSLDDRFTDYVPGFPSWASAITIGQLVHQTSGVPDYIGLLDLQKIDRHDVVTHTMALDAIRGAGAADFAPGEKWEYSNSNYVLLASVVDAVSGSSLAQVLAARVFGPLGLSMVMDTVNPIPGRATPYENVSGVDTRIDEVWEPVGDGGIQSTASDLARWGDNFRTGTVGGPALLAAQTADAVPAFPGRPITYGAGLYINPAGGVGHPGDWLGFVAAFSVSPDRRESLAILCNSWDIDASAVGVSLGDVWYTSGR